MGLCHEFGTQIREGCGHPMQAGQNACSCPECGAVCAGLFEGCPDVWERGPRPVVVAVKPDDVVNGGRSLRQPVAVARAGPAVLRAREEETERVIAAEAARALLDPQAVRRANAARVGAEQAQATVDRRAAAQAESDRRAAGEAEGPRRAEADRPAAAETDVAGVRTGSSEETAGGEKRPGPAATGAGPAATGATGGGSGPTEAGVGPPGAGGATGINGTRAALGSGTASAPADGRSDVLRWFDEAFAGLRRELRELLKGMTRQQAMLAELLDARQADLRLVVVAEGLPDVVQDAVEAAVADNTKELTETFEAALGELRRSVRDTEASSAAAVSDLRGALEARERSAAAAVDELRAALEASERSAAAALEEARRLQEEAEQREALRARALKAAFTKQLKPLAEAAQRAADSAASSDRRMDDILALLDAMADADVRPARPKAKKPAPAKRAAPKKTPARKAATTRAASAKKAAAPRSVLAAPEAAPLPAGRPRRLRGVAPLDDRR